MPEFKNILVPIDGSANSKRAIAHAGYLAEKCGAKLSVLHVINTFAQVSAFSDANTGLYIPDRVVEDIQEAGQAVIDQALSLLPQDVEAQNFIEIGSPTEVIVNYCKKDHYDVIVMGSRGLGIIKELIMGSVSSAVVYYAPCPVLIVK
ncbi:MAG: teaD [Firmicutes bacterium]|nr:teaD [Bacillota bacterium]